MVNTPLGVRIIIWLKVKVKIYNGLLARHRPGTSVCMWWLGLGQPSGVVGVLLGGAMMMVGGGQNVDDLGAGL